MEALHDKLISSLESPKKLGINTLLKKNNQQLKKQLYNFAATRQIRFDSGLFNALDHLLEVHAKECYVIGYLDGIGSAKSPD